MSEASIQINRTELDHLLNNPRGSLGREMHRQGALITQMARAQVGKKTGNLMRSITYSVTRSTAGQTLTVTATARNALMHHEGTRPHYIMPNASRVLRFKTGGRVVYAQRVLHPGTKPNRYLTDPMRRVVT